MVKQEIQRQMSARVYLKFIKKPILEVVLSAYYVTLQNICAVIAFKKDMCPGFLPPSSLSLSLAEFWIFFPLKALLDPLCTFYQLAAVHVINSLSKAFYVSTLFAREWISSVSIQYRKYYMWALAQMELPLP